MTLYKEFCIGQYDTLISKLKLLNNLKPNKSKEVLKNLYNQYLECLTFSTKFEKIMGDCTITEYEINELWIPVDGYWDTETIKVSPKGASILRDLYLSGVLVLQNKSAIEYNGELDEYITMDEKFLLEFKKLERINYLLNHIEEIKIDDFSYELLNKVFIERCGLSKGSQSLILDGVEVFKYVCPYKSNSGKTTDYEVKIYWTDKDGNEQEFFKDSVYSNNRRNDEVRNWGLGRE